MNHEKAMVTLGELKKHLKSLEESNQVSYADVIYTGGFTSVIFITRDGKLAEGIIDRVKMFIPKLTKTRKYAKYELFGMFAA